MYTALSELEREAEAMELECVLAAGAHNSHAAAACTEQFLERAEEIELTRLAAMAVGTGSEEPNAVARAGEEYA
jgi:hypothetical protein